MMKRISLFCSLLVILSACCSCSSQNNQVNETEHLIADLGQTTMSEITKDSPFIVVDYVVDRYGNLIQKTVYNKETRMTHIYNYLYEYVNGYHLIDHIETIVVEPGCEPYMTN